VDSAPQLGLGVRGDATARLVAVDDADYARYDDTEGVNHRCSMKKGVTRGETYKPPRRKMNNRRILRFGDSWSPRTIRTGSTRMMVSMTTSKAPVTIQKIL